MLTKHIQLLVDISNFRIISSSQAAVLLNMKARSVRKILGELVQLDYLNIIPRPYSGTSGRPENLYCLTVKSANLLRQEDILDKEISHQRILWEGRHSLEHQIALNWFFISAFVLGKQTPLEVSYISQTSPYSPSRPDGKCFLLEDIQKNEKTTVALIPDAVLCIQDPTTAKSSLFFIEIDRSTETLSGHVHKKNTIRNKIEHYKILFQSKNYIRYENLFDASFVGFRTLFVCDHHKRRDKILRLLEQLQHTNFLWVSTLDDIVQHGLGAKLWLYAGNLSEQPDSILGSLYCPEYTCPIRI